MRGDELAAVVESTTDAIVVCGLDGAITVWNAGAARMFGFTTQEALGMPILRIVPPERRSELNRLHERILAGELPEPFETVRMTREEHRLLVSIAAFAVRGENGAVTAIAASHRDLSETHLARTALQSEVQRRDEFLAMLSHELRGPLAPLRVAYDILSSSGATPDQIERSKAMMGRQLDHLTRLVDQLLDVSRISKGRVALQRKKVDLVEVVAHAVEDQRAFFESRGVSLQAKLGRGQLWIHGDRVRLAQAVGSVLHNAGKFTEEGSVEVRLRAEEGGRFAVLTVTDTGIGMEPAAIPHLFQPFAQSPSGGDRSRGGLGLGLGLARGLVELHGGTIEGRSEGPGRGSVFTIRLPVMPGARPPQEEASASVRTGGGTHWRILVVEDNRDTAESLRDSLALSGHEVAVAFDGESAVRLAKKLRPEVVLCDIGLPGGMDGYAVARALRADPSLSHVRLVAVTGFGQPKDEKRAREAGFELHFRKPADLTALLAGLESLREQSP
jgi:PAS domain S-box-containing protein